MGFPDSSVAKDSTCTAGDLCSIPGSGISAGEGIGYLLQYSWASLVAQLVQNLPPMRETWVWSLGWKDPLEKEKVLQYSGLENPMDYKVHGHKESDMTERIWLHFTSLQGQWYWRRQKGNLSEGLTQHIEFRDLSCTVLEERKGQSEDVVGRDGSAGYPGGRWRHSCLRERMGQLRGWRGHLVK